MSLSLSFSIYLCISHVSLILSLSLSLLISAFLSLSLSVSLSVCFSLSISLYDRPVHVCLGKAMEKVSL